MMSDKFSKIIIHPNHIISMNFAWTLAISLAVATDSIPSLSDASFSEISPTHVEAFAPAFTEYCDIDSTHHFEQNAVVSSFFGDHPGALFYATKRVVAREVVPLLAADASEVMLMEAELRHKLDDDSATDEEKQMVRAILTLLSSPTPEETFQGATAHNAKDFIVDSASNYHFLLINEAHYSSQNRAFTRSLLKPLWEQGYRYLALETLSYQDSSLMERDYPILSTGVYTQDPVFGNLVREALKLGYTLVSYETTKNHDGTLRDQDQARNIYEKTWQQDSVGKVLVHAGYDHISEMRSESYQPMGAQLKALLGQEILTVDQEMMQELLDSTKMNAYYRYTFNHRTLTKPTVFTTSGQVLMDPLTALKTDIQVYHPPTQYEAGAPTWLLAEDMNWYELPPTFNAYYGHLLQAVPLGERTDAVPVDQFVISAERKSLLLSPGSYQLRIVDCSGTLVGTSELVIEICNMD